MSDAGTIEGLTIDGMAFTRERSRVSGRLTLASLPRIAASGSGQADVAFSIEGRNAEGHPSLRVRADGTVEMSCQRCLQSLAVPVVVDAELELAESREAAEAADDDVDRVVASRNMDVAALVEDELLLELPMVATHENCRLPAEDDGLAPSPFAALAGLRKSGGG
jgi:uncharacterized protein